MDVQQRDDKRIRELALFAGAGGGILGGQLLGWRTVCAVERDAYAAQVLAQRQNDGILEAFPIWSDIEHFDGTKWRGIVDLISGGFPCQDISSAGKGAGIGGKRSGLWSHMQRVIDEVRPPYVFVENVPMLRSRGLDRVLGDLASLGYDARWGCVSARQCGALHKRDRIWISAWIPNTDDKSGATAYVSNGEGSGKSPTRCPNELDSSRDMANSNGFNEQGAKCQQPNKEVWAQSGERSARLQGVGEKWSWPAEPELGRVANGVAHRVDRLKAIGNGQVPRVAAAAHHLLSKPRF